MFPLPKQYALEPANIAAAKQFVSDSVFVNRHNPKIVEGINIIRGRSAMMPELEAYVKAADLISHLPAELRTGAIGLQHWYPRAWDEWASVRDSASPDQLVSKSEEFEFRDTDGAVSFNTVEPPFEIVRFNAAKFANDISLKFYGENEKSLADILPYDHGKEVLRAAGGPMPFRDDLRIGRSGLVHLASWRSRIHLSVPLGEDIFFAWLRDKGFQPELSTCGLLAKRVNAQLKGWLSVLGQEKLLQLLDRMNRGGEEGKGAEVGVVKTALEAIDSHNELYRRLSERGIFQLGFKTQCPLCRRGSWYSIREFGPELHCPLCPTCGEVVVLLFRKPRFIRSPLLVRPLFLGLVVAQVTLNCLKSLISLILLD